MNYFRKWLQSLMLRFELKFYGLNISVLFVNFFFATFGKGLPTQISLSIWFPKYSFMICNTQGEQDRKDYMFYSKQLYKNLYFYIAHVCGVRRVWNGGEEGEG